jgi:hypothetical protein
MSKDNNHDGSDEFIDDLEKILFKFYKKSQMTGGEITSLIKRQKQMVIQARYED